MLLLAAVLPSLMLMLVQLAYVRAVAAEAAAAAGPHVQQGQPQLPTFAHTLPCELVVLAAMVDKRCHLCPVNTCSRTQGTRQDGDGWQHCSRRSVQPGLKWLQRANSSVLVCARTSDYPPMHAPKRRRNTSKTCAAESYHACTGCLIRPPASSLACRVRSATSRCHSQPQPFARRIVDLLKLLHVLWQATQHDC